MENIDPDSHKKFVCHLAKFFYDSIMGTLNNPEGNILHQTNYPPTETHPPENTKFQYNTDIDNSIIEDEMNNNLKKNLKQKRDPSIMNQSQIMINC